MTGGLLQLVSYGIEDEMLIKNPEITFFKKVFRNYSNFTIDTITSLHNVKFGMLKTIEIPKTGDLLYKLFIKLELPKVISKLNENYKTINDIIINNNYNYSYNKYINNITLLYNIKNYIESELNYYYNINNNRSLNGFIYFKSNNNTLLGTIIYDTFNCSELVYSINNNNNIDIYKTYYYKTRRKLFDTEIFLDLNIKTISNYINLNFTNENRFYQKNDNLYLNIFDKFYQTYLVALYNLIYEKNIIYTLLLFINTQLKINLYSYKITNTYDFTSEFINSYLSEYIKLEYLRQDLLINNTTIDNINNIIFELGVNGYISTYDNDYNSIPNYLIFTDKEDNSILIPVYIKNIYYDNNSFKYDGYIMNIYIYDTLIRNFKNSINDYIICPKYYYSKETNMYNYTYIYIKYNDIICTTNNISYYYTIQIEEFTEDILNYINNIKYILLTNNSSNLLYNKYEYSDIYKLYPFIILLIDSMKKYEIINDILHIYCKNTIYNGSYDNINIVSPYIPILIDNKMFNNYNINTDYYNQIIYNHNNRLITNNNLYIDILNNYNYLTIFFNALYSTYPLYIRCNLNKVTFQIETNIQIINFDNYTNNIFNNILDIDNNLFIYNINKALINFKKELITSYYNINDNKNQIFIDQININKILYNLKKNNLQSKYSNSLELNNIIYIIYDNYIYIKNILYYNNISLLEFNNEYEEIYQLKLLSPNNNFTIEDLNYINENIKLKYSYNFDRFKIVYIYTIIQILNKNTIEINILANININIVDIYTSIEYNEIDKLPDELLYIKSQIAIIPNNILNTSYQLIYESNSSLLVILNDNIYNKKVYIKPYYISSQLDFNLYDIYNIIKSNTNILYIISSIQYYFGKFTYDSLSVNNNDFSNLFISDIYSLILYNAYKEIINDININIINIISLIIQNIGYLIASIYNDNYLNYNSNLSDNIIQLNPLNSLTNINKIEVQNNYSFYNIITNNYIFNSYQVYNTANLIVKSLDYYIYNLIENTIYDYEVILKILNKNISLYIDLDNYIFLLEKNYNIYNIIKINNILFPFYNNKPKYVFDNNNNLIINKIKDKINNFIDYDITRYDNTYTNIYPNIKINNKTYSILNINTALNIINNYPLDINKKILNDIISLFDLSNENYYDKNILLNLLESNNDIIYLDIYNIINNGISLYLKIYLQRSDLFNSFTNNIFIYLKKEDIVTEFLKNMNKYDYIDYTDSTKIKLSFYFTLLKFTNNKPFNQIIINIYNKFINDILLNNEYLLPSDNLTDNYERKCALSYTLGIKIMKLFNNYIIDKKKLLGSIGYYKSNNYIINGIIKNNKFNGTINNLEFNDCTINISKLISGNYNYKIYNNDYLLYFQFNYKDILEYIDNINIYISIQHKLLYNKFSFDKEIKDNINLITLDKLLKLLLESGNNILKMSELINKLFNIIYYTIINYDFYINIKNNLSKLNFDENVKELYNKPIKILYNNNNNIIIDQRYIINNFKKYNQYILDNYKEDRDFINELVNSDLMIFNNEVINNIIQLYQKVINYNLIDKYFPINTKTLIIKLSNNKSINSLNIIYNKINEQLNKENNLFIFNKQKNIIYNDYLNYYDKLYYLYNYIITLFYDSPLIDFIKDTNDISKQYNILLLNWNNNNNNNNNNDIIILYNIVKFSELNSLYNINYNILSLYYNIYNIIIYFSNRLDDNIIFDTKLGNMYWNFINNKSYINIKYLYSFINKWSYIINDILSNKIDREQLDIIYNDPICKIIYNNMHILLYIITHISNYMCISDILNKKLSDIDNNIYYLSNDITYINNKYNTKYLPNINDNTNLNYELYLNSKDINNYFSGVLKYNIENDNNSICKNIVLTINEQYNAYLNLFDTLFNYKGSIDSLRFIDIYNHINSYNWDNEKLNMRNLNISDLRNNIFDNIELVKYNFRTNLTVSKFMMNKNYNINIINFKNTFNELVQKYKKNFNITSEILYLNKNENISIEKMYTKLLYNYNKNIDINNLHYIYNKFNGYNKENTLDYLNNIIKYYNNNNNILRIIKDSYINSNIYQIIDLNNLNKYIDLYGNNIEFLKNYINLLEKDNKIIYSIFYPKNINKPLIINDNVESYFTLKLMKMVNITNRNYIYNNTKCSYAINDAVNNFLNLSNNEKIKIIYLYSDIKIIIMKIIKYLLISDQNHIYNIDKINILEKVVKNYKYRDIILTNDEYNKIIIEEMNYNFDTGSIGILINNLDKNNNIINYKNIRELLKSGKLKFKELDFKLYRKTDLPSEYKYIFKDLNIERIKLVYYIDDIIYLNIYNELSISNSYILITKIFKSFIIYKNASKLLNVINKKLDNKSHMLYNIIDRFTSKDFIDIINILVSCYTSIDLRKDYLINNLNLSLNLINQFLLEKYSLVYIEEILLKIDNPVIYLSILYSVSFLKPNILLEYDANYIANIILKLYNDDIKNQIKRLINDMKLIDSDKTSNILEIIYIYNIKFNKNILDNSLFNNISIDKLNIDKFIFLDLLIINDIDVLYNIIYLIYEKINMKYYLGNLLYELYIYHSKSYNKFNIIFDLMRYINKINNQLYIYIIDLIRCLDIEYNNDNPINIEIQKEISFVSYNNSIKIEIINIYNKNILNLDDINITINIDDYYYIGIGKKIPYILLNEKNNYNIRINNRIIDLKHKFLKKINNDNTEEIYTISSINNFCKYLFIYFPYDIFKLDIITYLIINNMKYNKKDIQYYKYTEFIKDNNIDHIVGIYPIYDLNNITIIEIENFRIDLNYIISIEVSLLINKIDDLNILNNFNLNDDIIKTRIISIYDIYSNIILDRDLLNINKITSFQIGYKNILNSELDTKIYTKINKTLVDIDYIDIFDNFDINKILNIKLSDYQSLIHLLEKEDIGNNIINNQEYIDKIILDYKELDKDNKIILEKIKISNPLKENFINNNNNLTTLLSNIDNLLDNEDNYLLLRNNLYIEGNKILNLSQYPKFSYIPYLIDFIFDSIELQVDGLTIDKINDVYLYIYHNLILSKEKQRDYYKNNLNSLLLLESEIKDSFILYIDVPFYFNKISKEQNYMNNELVEQYYILPLISSIYSKLELKIKLKNLEDITIFNDNIRMICTNDIKLTCIYDVIYLDEKERGMFVNKRNEYLFIQNQYISTIYANKEKIENIQILSFKNPIKDMFYFIRLNKNLKLKQYYNFTFNYLLPELYMDNRDKIIYLDQIYNKYYYDIDIDIQNLYIKLNKIKLNKLNKFKLSNINILDENNLKLLYNNLNINDIKYINNLFEEYYIKKYEYDTLTYSNLYLNDVLRYKLDGGFTNKVIPYEYYNNSVPGLYIYTFSLKPLNNHPTGSTNFTNLQSSFQIKLENNNLSSTDIIIFNNIAHNYNILDIMSGMMSIRWNNI